MKNPSLALAIILASAVSAKERGAACFNRAPAAYNQMDIAPSAPRHIRQHQRQAPPVLWTEEEMAEQHALEKNRRRLSQRYHQQRSTTSKQTRKDEARTTTTLTAASSGIKYRFSNQAPTMAPANDSTEPAPSYQRNDLDTPYSNVGVQHAHEFSAAPVATRIMEQQQQEAAVHSQEQKPQSSVPLSSAHMSA